MAKSTKTTKATKTAKRSPLAANLRAARIAAGFESASEAARYLGIPVPTAVAHEGAGTSFRRPKLEHLRKYAQAYGTTIDALEGGTIISVGSPPSSVRTREVPVSQNLVSAPILGTAAAGQWREVDPFAAEAAGSVPVKPGKDFVFAVQVEGDSMNRIIHDGDVAIVRPWALMKRDPYNNDVLLVQREKAGKYELTVKTYRDGQLWPESTNPRWRHPVPMKNGDTVTVVGLVVGLYRPL